MCWTVSLFHLVLLIINPGELIAVDEGTFLWAPRNVLNHTDNSKSMMKPGRWTRSIFNWLHSPLINSIQEAFVIDSVYENVEPVTKCVKRCVDRQLKAGESFENEFFLWEDNERKPLEFGLKQIKQMKPYPFEDHAYQHPGLELSIWEEPLFYEDNQDVKEIDVSHLSYHEKLKLNDLKGKVQSLFHQFLPQKRSSKNHTIYYTLYPTVPKNTSLTKNNFKNFVKEIAKAPKNSEGYYIENKRKFDNLTDLRTFVANNNQSNSAFDDFKQYRNNQSALSGDRNIGTFNMSETIPLNLVENHVLNQYSTIDTIKKHNISMNSTPINYQNSNTLGLNNRNTERLENLSDLPLDSLLAFHKTNLKEEESSNLMGYGMIDDANISPSNVDVRKYGLMDGPKQRNLRRAHHRGFLRHRRKYQKLKHPQGLSIQY